MPETDSEAENDAKGPPENRRWVSAEIGGRHIFPSEAGNLSIVRRGNQYMVRGRIDGRQFAETLGTIESAVDVGGESVRRAEAKLWSIIADINAGRYVVPGERSRRPLPARTYHRQTPRDILDAFLADVARTKSVKTAAVYTSRLKHVLAFLERGEIRKRWAWASTVDREFVISLKQFLFGCEVTANGRPGAPTKRISARGVQLALETLRNALHWAGRPQVGRLPADFVNPVSADLLGDRPRRDPFRPSPFPLEDLVRLVEAADIFELQVLGLSFVLPLRPSEATGILISEIDFDRRRIRFSTRMGGDDFTKAKTAFTLPFPAELAPLLAALRGGRAEGPLLRRHIHRRKGTSGAFDSTAALRDAYARWLAKRPNADVATSGDRKEAFRDFLVQNGAMSADGLSQTFRRLQGRVFGGVKRRLYDLRHAATDAMNRAGLSLLGARYFTSHACDDILNVYAGFDIDGEAGKYFGVIRPLLDAIAEKCREFGLRGAEDAA